MLTKTLVVGLGLSLFAVGTVSQENTTPQFHMFQDGNQLLKFCEDESDIATSFCAGYMTGTADHFMLTKAFFKFAKQGGEGGTCLPERATPRQLIDVFVKYAKNHPEERHKAAQFMISSAWGEAFPCK